MPDSTTVPMAEGGRKTGGGLPMPLIIGGGVGLVVLIIFLNQKTGGGGAPATTAAGTSINAALGSIQEQNLNLMGQVGQSEQRLSSELGAVNNNVIAGSTATHDLIGSTNQFFYYLQASYYGHAQMDAASARGDMSAWQAWKDWTEQFTNATSNAKYFSIANSALPNFDTHYWTDSGVDNNAVAA